VIQIRKMSLLQEVTKIRRYEYDRSSNFYHNSQSQRFNYTIKWVLYLIILKTCGLVESVGGLRFKL